MKNRIFDLLLLTALLLSVAAAISIKVLLISKIEPPTVFEHKYSSELYNYEIQYPSNWKFSTYDWKFDYRSDKFVRTINLQKMMAEGDKRPAPEITIGSAGVYSTSGALCSNERCLFNAGKLKLNPKLQTAELTGLDRTKTNDQKNSYMLYRFQIPVPEIEALGQPIYITAQYIEDGDKETIVSILSTLRVK